MRDSTLYAMTKIWPNEWERSIAIQQYEKGDREVLDLVTAYWQNVNESITGEGV